MPSKRGPLSEKTELSGHMIENNGEDLEYLNALSKVSDEQLKEGWKALHALFKKQKEAKKGPLAEEDLMESFLRKYNL